MFIFGHVGIALAAWLWLERRADLPFVKTRTLMLLATAAMLPDIVDKPVGHLLFPALNNGRLVCHSLIFFVVLAAAAALAFMVNRQRFLWTLPLGLGVGCHLALDQIWLSDTLFWPFTGWHFPPGEGDVLAGWLASLTGDPYVLGGELVGGALFVASAVYLHRDQRLPWEGR